MKSKRRRERKTSQRANLERTIGRKFLKGEIPVVPPSQLHRCPVPTTHVEHDTLCREYEEGKISYDQLLAKVGEAFKKPEPEQPKPPEEGAPP